MRQRRAKRRGGQGLPPRPFGRRLRLGALRYLGDQPWGVSGSQMFAFQAEAQEGDIRLQESELCEAGWFRRDELEPRGRTVSIALELIERFRTGTL